MERVEVCVRDGKLVGIVEKGIYGGRYVAFRGIPYAKPPIGELRFKDPVPPEPWSGSRDASKYGNVAVQIDIIQKSEIIGDEDCLYLNVFTTDIKSSEKRPVMVWIHGGGFYIGSGDSTFYGPDYIVEKDIVLVTLNYRLGVLGFLNLYDKVATGNQGLKDVILALHWVQENISEFGGDSENVTIFGESAGGAIVHYLTLSQLSEGLFHKAISQSGTVTCPWAFTDPESYSTNKGFLLAKKLGKVTEDPKDVYEFLKTIDAKKLVETEKFLVTEEERRQFLVIFTPTLDHESSNPVFPEDLTTLIHRGVKVPYLLGFTSCEGSFLLKSNFIGCISKEALNRVDSDFKLAIHPRVLNTLPKISTTLCQLRSLYFGDKNISEETVANYINLISDTYFLRGIMQAVDIQMNNDNSGKTYLYQFSYESETSFMKKISNVDFPGVSHGEELGYLFYADIIKELGLSVPVPDSEDYKMINRLTQMWTDFAKTGNPTPAITDLTPIKWIPLKREAVYDYLDIHIEPRMKTLHKGKQRWDWENMNNISYDYSVYKI
ncbi:esterase E4 isoform X1 [Camponotus floridanus]|uniref:esterase E4 isoform X1 n=1 Tax=Camponotus floridanus TaxID=104421 RepID=UPI000DC6B69F|nr:esterase E4 isoform X1 [Camponotus floridanus]XP_025262686.1 esterase E4 isoform X1 [Camponotus floridanus]